MRRSLLTCASLILLSTAQAVETQGALSVAPTHRQEPATPRLGSVVDTIVIENREVYDTGNPKYNNFLFRLANKVHVTTRDGVVRRELLFREGEPFPYELAEESARNIRTRLSVYDAWIETETLPNGHLLVRVVTIDEWTLAVGPNVRREGNENRYDFSLVERNLLGRNQQVSARYVFQSIEGDFADLSYGNSRLWGKGISFESGFRNDPQDGIRWLRVGHPFYNLSQDYAYSFAIGSHDGRRDVYQDDALIGQSDREGDWFEAKVQTRTGTYHRKLELTSRYEYRYGKTLDKRVYSDEPEDIADATASFGADSIYHAVELGLAFSNLHFTKMTQIDGFSYTEDFTLGQGIGLSFGRAFSPGLRDHVYDNMAVLLAQGYRLGSNLLFASYERVFWFHGRDDIRKTARFSGRIYSRATDYLTLVWRGAYISDWRVDGSEGLVLGGESGLRGYDRYFRTGDRMAIMNLEARFFPSVRLHSVVFSPVMFADFGQAWKRGEELNFDAIHAAVGAGIRVALEHSARERLIRFDFSYSEVNGWQLSVSGYHYFGAPASGFFLTSP